MPITVTFSGPDDRPRASLQVSSSNGSPITAISIVRWAYGAGQQIRFQPGTGPSPRFANDYEMPWDTSVQYVATVTSGAGTETFSTAYLTPTWSKPWVIHPTTPGLSRVLDSGSPLSMGVASLGAVSRPSATTGHDVIGAKYRVITRVGPRQASRLQMEIATVTPFEQSSIWALVEDQTPLLFRMPAAWGWDFEDGYYDVGQVDASRVVQYGPEHRRLFTLPLERVEAPSGTQQADWTYQNVKDTFGSYTALRNSYATYADMVTDSRR